MPPLPLTDATADTEDRRLLQFPSVMQYQRDMPGRIIFTIGVGMSSTCVALILILWVGGQWEDLFAGARHRDWFTSWSGATHRPAPQRRPSVLVAVARRRQPDLAKPGRPPRVATPPADLAACDPTDGRFRNPSNVGPGPSGVTPVSSDYRGLASSVGRFHWHV
jgi:hypothetical protein